MCGYVVVAILLVAVMRSSAIVELNDNSFFDYARDKEVLLVDFYAPWCSDCQKLAPDFENAGAILGARSANLAKIDCFGAGKGVCQMYGVKSWPQLKNFNRGTYTGDYTGEQTGEAMASYINTVVNAAQTNPLAIASPYATNVAPYPVYAAPAHQALHVQTAFAPKVPAAAAWPLPFQIAKSEACAKCDTPRYPVPAFRVPVPFMAPCIQGRSCITKTGQTVVEASSKGENQDLKKSSTGEPKEARVKDESTVNAHDSHTQKGILNITMKNVKKTDVKPLSPRDMPDDKRTLKDVLLGKATSKKAT